MPNHVDMQIGRQIRSLRQSQALSEEALAVRIGVTRQQVEKYEKGTSRVSLRRLMAIADVLGSHVSVFFDGFQKPDVGNDNLPAADLMTKQGLVLLKLFHSIRDPELRYQALRAVQRIASGQKSHGP